MKSICNKRNEEKKKKRKIEKKKNRKKRNKNKSVSSLALVEHSMTRTTRVSERDKE